MDNFYQLYYWVRNYPILFMQFENTLFDYMEENLVPKGKKAMQRVQQKILSAYISNRTQRGDVSSAAF